jgi:hypothetical protein
MKAVRLLVLTCVAGLMAGACADDPGGRGGVPTEPSFKPEPKPPPTACELVAGAIGDVFGGNAKNDFGNLLGLDDGTISSPDLFNAASAISVAFNGRDASDELSEAFLNSGFASWVGTLGRNATPEDGALLTRLIFECAATDGTDSGDAFTTKSDSTNDAAFPWADFQDDVEKALDQARGSFPTVGYGSFAVRNDPNGGAGGPYLEVASPDYTNGPFWYVTPTGNDTWDTVFGQQVLIYGYGRTRFVGNEEQLGESYEWKVLPTFDDGFLTDVGVVTCQDSEGGQGVTGARIQRRGNVLSNFSVGVLCDFPEPPQASDANSVLSRIVHAVGKVFTPPALHADAAVVVGGGFGGFASKWSPFDPSFIGAVELVFDNQPCKDQLESTADGTFTNELDFEPCIVNTEELRLIAQTVNGSPIEDIGIQVSAVDNNGQNKGLGTIVGGVCTPNDSIIEVTQNDAQGDAGVAVFEDLCVIGRGGFRLRASAPDFPFDFAPVDSDGFNVKPVN